MLALSAVLVLAIADRAAYAWSLDRMLDSVEATEDVMVDEGDRVRAFTAGRPAASTAQEAAEMRAEVQRIYAGLEEDLVVAADPMRGQLLAPWWRALSEVRGDYLNHVGAWEERFARVQEDLSTYNQRSADIGATFRLACDAMRRAVPTVDVWGSGERVESACES